MRKYVPMGPAIIAAVKPSNLYMTDLKQITHSQAKIPPRSRSSRKREIGFGDSRWNGWGNSRLLRGVGEVFVGVVGFLELFFI